MKKKKLAASFVVTTTSLAAVALGAGEVGCRKQGVEEGEGGGVSVYRGSAYQGDACFMSFHYSCPRGATCNPPPPEMVDCPPSLRDASSDPPVSTRRPPDKADWLRVTPIVWPQDKGECVYRPEYFCAPKGAKRADCTQSPATVKMKCHPPDASDGGGKDAADASPRPTVPPPASPGQPTVIVSSFVYKDGLGECRKVPESPCLATRHGGCVVPDGDVVPCP